MCHKELTVSALGNHYGTETCKKLKTPTNTINIPKDITCILCSRRCKSDMAYRQHYIRCNLNPNKLERSTKQKVRQSPAWNKGLTKETDDRVAANSIAVSKATIGKIGRPHSEETKRKISQKLSINNKGGRAKWHEVAGQKVQGTWERNVAVKFEELGIKWVKLKVHKDILEYVMDDNVRSYTPDFYLPAYDVYLEIKGYWWGRDREKMDIVLRTYPDKKIIIVEKTDYVRILRGELVW